MKTIAERKLKILDGFSDVVLILCAFLAAFYIRFDVLNGKLNQSQSAAVGPQFAATVVYALLLMMAYYFSRRYDYYRHYKIERDITAVLIINSVGTLCYMAFLYLAKFPDFSRGAITMFFVFATVLVIGKRLIAVRIRRYSREKGYHVRHVIVIGGGHLAEQFIRSTQTEKDIRICVDGFVAGEDRPELGTYLGGYAELGRILEEREPDELVIALEPREAERMEQVLPACEHSGTRTCIIPYYNDYLPNSPEIEVFGKSKLINIRSIPLDNLFSAALKRSFDFLASGVLLLLLSPLMLLTALGIKLTDPGPVFFCQKRVGKNKKPFVMYKFRSMPVNVDHSGWSTKTDSRRTRFGSLIRKLSIDELPQLWNVFIGDMSLVGPRPELPNYVRQFSADIPLYLVRQQVRPGMTGLAQINGLRGDTSIEERVKYDIHYIETWTWMLDLKILIKTAFGGFINQEQKSAPSSKHKEQRSYGLFSGRGTGGNNV